MKTENIFNNDTLLSQLEDSLEMDTLNFDMLDLPAQNIDTGQQITPQYFTTISPNNLQTQSPQIMVPSQQLHSPIQSSLQSSPATQVVPLSPQSASQNIQQIQNTSTPIQQTTTPTNPILMRAHIPVQNAATKVMYSTVPTQRMAANTQVSLKNISIFHGPLKVHIIAIRGEDEWCLRK